MNEKLNISLDGSRMTALHTERKTITFAVTEIELDTISFINDACLLLSSFGTFCLTEFWSNTKAKTENYFWFSDILFWIALALYGLALFAFFKKKSILKKIKEQAGH